MSIKTRNIADLAVTAAKIASATITGAKIAAATLTGANLAPAALVTTPYTDMIRVAVATYDFAVDGGGAPGLITPAKTVSIPAGAIVMGAAVKIITTFTSAANAATLTIGTSAGSSSSSIKTGTVATNDATLAANAVSCVVVPIFTVATWFRMSAAGNITLTSTTAAFTAGKCDIFVFYTIGSTA